MIITEFFWNNRFKNLACYHIARLLYEIRITWYNRIPSQEKQIRSHYKRVFGVEPNLTDPKTLNEKLQWLKLNDHKDFYTICADKYGVREYISNLFGEEFLIPLYFHTDNWKDINPQNIKEYPCIVKANHSSKDYVILRSPSDVNWKKLQLQCRWWLHRDYYAESGEWQYKNIKRQIVVEKLLQTAEGRIPNDYKLHYINGTLQFVYVSVDREGCNARNIYDANWKPLLFQWNGPDKNAKNRRGDEIPAPPSFDQMQEYGKIIAEQFPYVRVDYYDVDGRLYFGEITLQHGGGYDVFVPDSYDLHYGSILKI